MDARARLAILVLCLLASCSCEESTVLASSKKHPRCIWLDLGGGVAMKLVRIDPGTLVLRDAGSERKVTFKRSYYLGATEVSNVQFRRFRPNRHSDGFENPRYRRIGLDFDGGEKPVVCNWLDAIAFVDWLGRLSGRKVRLPSEAEWEYAARAGATTTFSWGDDPGKAPRYANGNEPVSHALLVTGDDVFPRDDRFRGTAPVGSFLANPWGLHDMHGNVFEWCADGPSEDYGDTPEDGSPRPDKAVVGPRDLRVLRGGAFNVGPGLTAAGARHACPAGVHHDSAGFRLLVETEED